ncbi:MAG: hypothetical protein COA97_08745 [Flavobacteriales bacterium]|nr:MAG: hypothetical protein COA97_08745 [Flavobacteriales bacterium]
MKNTLLIILSIISTVCFSQTNLVPNSTFEKIEKKIKGKGEINVATPWTSPTLAQADLYVPKTKNYNISIPENSYGEEKPMEGTGYAGIIGYSYKNKVPRSYLQVQLTEQLEEGKEYCIKYHVSLADLSKYSCNHLGVAITDKAMTANNSDILKFDSYIESRKLVVYETQFYWTPICGVYKAKGGEEYLTIGNFTEDAKLQLKKVKRPRGFTKPQTYDAYYFIDNVSVTPIEEAKKCDCDATPGMENAETIKRDFNSDKSVSAKTLKIINTDGTTSSDKKTTSAAESDANPEVNEDVDGMIIAFSPKLYAIGGAATSQLDIVASYLKANKTHKIAITGYVDASESDVDKLDGRRVGAVYKYLISKGVAKERIEREMGGEDAIDEKKKTKNMRVEIALITE